MCNIPTIIESVKIVKSMGKIRAYKVENPPENFQYPNEPVRT